jgi:GGDEF domain-containing protein
MMISLTTSMKLDEVRCVLDEICGAYCGALSSAHDSVIDVKGLPAWERREEFSAIAAKGRRSVERLNTSGLPEIERELRAAHKRQVAGVRELVSKLAAEKDETMTALREALASLTSHDSGGTERAAAEVVRMRNLADLDDVAQIKCGIREAASRLEACITAIQREKDTVILMLRDEIRTLQRSLDQVKAGGSGVLSRSQFEACLRRTIASKVSFCAIQISIRNRAQIERLRGHGAAEHAIRTFTTAVQEMLPPGSVTGIWDESELCAIVLVSYQDAIQKTREIGMFLEHAETRAGSAPLKAQLMTVPFNADEGQEKLAKRMQKVMAG